MVTVNGEILKAIEGGHRLLSDEARVLIRNFLRSCQHHEGGFTDRANTPDPYYSVYGYFLAYVFDLEINIKKERAFLDSWKKNNPIDLIHAVCLLQCAFLIEAIYQKSKDNKIMYLLSNSELLKKQLKSLIAKKVLKEHIDLTDLIFKYNTPNGGFNALDKNAKFANIYASFLVLNLLIDLNLLNSKSELFIENIQDYQLADGSFVNEINAENGTSSVTAAGIILSLYSKNMESQKGIQWLMDQKKTNGGFAIGSDVPIADLLSTATTMLSLHMNGEPKSNYNLNVFEFINLHWDESGGFFGSVADMHPDCEYTFYALLCLGLI